MSSSVDERPTDAELVGRFQRDPEEFHAVYDRYYRAVRLYVAGRLDVQVADDLASETFLVAFGQRHRFDPGRGGLQPWLFGIATNLVARHRRREAQHFRALARRPPEQVVDSHEHRVVTSVTARRMQPQLALALTRLSRGELDVVLLMALAQLTHEEIAEALDISYGTVGSRLSRARKKLRHAIGKEGFCE